MRMHGTALEGQHVLAEHVVEVILPPQLLPLHHQPP